MLRKYLVHVSFFVVLSMPICAFGYDNEDSHPDFSDYATTMSVLGSTKFLEEMGFDKGIDSYIQGLPIRKFIRLGAELEDAGSDFDAILGRARFKNHFHNPLEDWSEAGLSDVQNGLSMVLWAQDSSSQQGATEGDWSWQTLRTHFLKALTAGTEAEREEYFAKTFRGLGHQMHLIQDAGQPDHVRNDAHPMDGKGLRLHIGYEKWAKEQRGYIRSLASNPAFPQVSMNRSPENGLAPVARLIDANLYTGTVPMAGTTQGLAEYANSNFFSDDTIFAAERFSPGDKHYFPYPKASSTNLREYVDGTIVPERTTALDGTDGYAVWIKKEWDGEIVNHLVRPSFFSEIVLKTIGEGNLFYTTFYRDKICHIDYAQKLIPRAVGYSAALIDYFFRAKIDMVADPNNSGQYVIKNVSDEDMSGTFRLYYDDKDGNRKPVSEDSEWPLSIPANGMSTPVTFPEPTDAKEAGKYMLVFQGSLGAEEGAVLGRAVNLGPKGSFLLIKQLFWTSNITGGQFESNNNGDLVSSSYEVEGYGGSWKLSNDASGKWELEWIGKSNKITNVTLIDFYNYYSCGYTTVASLKNQGTHSITLSEPSNGNKGYIEVNLNKAHPVPTYLKIDTVESDGENKSYYEPIFSPFNRIYSIRYYYYGWWNYIEKNFQVSINIHSEWNGCADLNASYYFEVFSPLSSHIEKDDPPFYTFHTTRRSSPYKYEYYILESWEDYSDYPVPVPQLFNYTREKLRVKRTWKQSTLDYLKSAGYDIEKLPSWDIYVDYWN